MRWYSSETQIRWVCRQLLKGREISHACEIAEAKGWRLSAIIYNLRHKYKWPITTRYNNDRIAFYRLGEVSDKEELALPKSARTIKKDDAPTSSQN